MTEGSRAVRGIEAEVEGNEEENKTVAISDQLHPLSSNTKAGVNNPREASAELHVQ